MPYIKPSRRIVLNELIETLSDHINSAGEFNYAITRLVHDMVERMGLNYATINEVIGVLECVKLELYRMVAAPYENKKREANGHISELDNDTVIPACNRRVCL